MDTSKRILPEHEKDFPNLFSSGYGKTSEEDEYYNCIAWAAGEENNEDFWTPYHIGNGYYWPEGIDRKADLDTFIKLYKLEGGFDPCENDSTDLVDGIEKIALYIDNQNEISHAARQKEDGSWASKLGSWEDIEHYQLDGLCGSKIKPAYGKVIKILQRPRYQK